MPPDTIPLGAAAPDHSPPDLAGAPRGRRAARAWLRAIEALLVGNEQAAAFCAIGRSTWFRLRSAGKTPAPVKLGGRVLYRVEDLCQWVALGCPPRKEFEARKAAAQGGARPR